MVEGLSTYASDLMIPFMCTVFGLGVVIRVVIWFTVKREEWFAKEFEKRIHRTIDEQSEKLPNSFYVGVKRLLEKTYYEIFEYRGIKKRRDTDYITSLTDRVFLIQHGCALLVRDTLKQIKYLKHDTGAHPKLLEIVKSTFKNNPCFSKIFGVFPAGKYNDLLNILPGLFIIGGIFGTFLGIMKGLPELKEMNLAQVQQTQDTMKIFLERIAFSMGTSIIGIILSVTMLVVNTIFSPEKVFISTVDRFENALDLLWYRSSNNLLPEEIPDFDEHRDPIEAIREQKLEEEIAKRDSSSRYKISKTEKDIKENSREAS